MKAEGSNKHSRAGEKVKLVTMDATEQTSRMQAAVARRAYAIFETRGATPSHELEDWRQAERELVSPLCCGRMTVDDSLWVGSDITVFEQGSVEVWLAPRKITICGKPRRDKGGTHRKHMGSHPGHPGCETIFHVLDLPVEVDPSHVTAKFNGPSLEILLREAQAKPQQEALAAAA